MSEETIGELVRYRYDPSNPATLTVEEQARLDAMDEEDIDLTDIPSRAGKRGWRPGLLGTELIDVGCAAVRQGLLLLDEDVVASLKQSLDDSPAKLNAVLREYAETHRKTA